MRIGLSVRGDGFAPLAAAATEADRIGLDLLHIETDAATDPLVTASSLAAVTRWITLVATVEVGMHPLHLAERIAVADRVLGGRLVVVLDGHGDTGLLTETIEVLDRALAGVPFRHRGARWSIPANLPANEHAAWDAVRMSPAPAQAEFPLWLTGGGAGEVGLAQARPAVLDGSVAGERWWAEVEQRWGPLARRMARPMIADLDPAAAALPAADPASPVAWLREEQRRWGTTSALLRVGEPGADLFGHVSRIRAAVQLPELPDGLDDFWEATVPARRISPPS